MLRWFKQKKKTIYRHHNKRRRKRITIKQRFFKDLHNVTWKNIENMGNRFPKKKKI